MKLGKFLAGACFASAMMVSATAQAADIVIGVPNWPSVKVTAHVLKVVLEDNLGLDVELQTGKTQSFSKPWTPVPCMYIRKSGCRTRSTCTTRL